MLSAAVEENADTIAGRPPKPLRFEERLKATWEPRARLGVPIAIVVALVGTVRWPVERPQVPVSGTSQTPVARSEPVHGEGRVTEPEPLVDPTALTRPVDPNVLELGVRRVILDAGHGGDNRGTASASGLLEKDLTLDIAQRTRDVLAVRGFEVLMTRTDDASISLQERAALANKRHGDIFVSVHLNSFQPASSRGIETYYLGPSDGPEHDALATVENQQSGYSLSDMRSMLERIYADARRDESRRLADAVQLSLIRRMRQVDPGLTNRGVKKAPFVVLVATEMPAILAEVSCLSNAEEAARLNAPGYRQTLAEALAAGIQAFASSPGRAIRSSRQTRGTAHERTETSGS